MKRTLSALAAAVAALLLVVAAPALSARPYQPPAVDFEMAAPAVAPKAAGAGGGGAGGGAASAAGRAAPGVTSPALRAPKRFNVVGLRWSGRALPHVHIRVRSAADARWSAWRELPVGRGYTDAAWAGDADRVQYRLSRAVPGVRIHFVNTLGTSTAAERVKTAVRRAANRGVIAAARVFGAADASAAASRPAIVPRSGWNAQDCPPRAAAQYGQVKLAFVHHTVTLNDYSADESPSIVLGICRYHRNSNGWNDIGYNFLVDKYGTIFEGRAGGIDRPVVGAQAEGFNSQSTGIANLGDYSSTPQSDAALQAMAKLIRWKLPLEGAETSGTVQVTSAGGSTNRFPAGTSTTLDRISGHRDGNNTECPGDGLYSQLPELRRLVGDVQPAPAGGASPASPASTRLTAAASPATVKVPAATEVRGRLATKDGSPVGGEPVAIEQLRGKSWRPAAEATTDASGDFSAPVAPSANATLRAVFAGASAYRHSTSSRTSVKVRPDMTLKAPAAMLTTGARIRLRGGIRPAKSLVAIVVERRAGGRYRRVSLTPVRPAARGRYGLTLRLRRSGRYRAYARFAGDASNVATRSPRAYFRLAPAAGGGAPAP
jgi:hypothetical protein